LGGVFVGSSELVAFFGHFVEAEFVVGGLLDVVVFASVEVLHLALQVQVHPFEVGHSFPELLLPGLSVGYFFKEFFSFLV